jgi:hypothetical protein
LLLKNLVSLPLLRQGVLFATEATSGAPTQEIQHH